jgi:ppGpp synthetase/RelA/SpoT-type nucleotidyltranferase
MNQKTRKAPTPKMMEFAKELTAEYVKRRPIYEVLAREVHYFLFDKLQEQAKITKPFKILNVTGRDKEPEKLEVKARRSSERDDNIPFYIDPFGTSKYSIPDLAGIRAIVYCLDDIQYVENIINKYFLPINREDKKDVLERKKSFGYRAIHYWVKLKDLTISRVKNKELLDKMVEIQISTALGHAWSEVYHPVYDRLTHQIGEPVPNEKIRRFVGVAVLLEIADDELNRLNKTLE